MADWAVAVPGFSGKACVVQADTYEAAAELVRRVYPGGTIVGQIVGWVPDTLKVMVKA